MSLQRTATLAGVWILIAYEFISYNWLFVPYFIQQYPILFPLTYIPFIIFVIMLCICYYKAIVTPPGSPSPMLNNNYLDLQGIKARAKEEQRLKREMRKASHTTVQFDQIELLTRVSYCFKCDRIKPIRAHHCKICGVCIERMDHHCPWVGNCVGRDNHKYFIQFLLYASSALAILAFTVLYDAFLAKDGIVSKMEETDRLLVYINGFSSLALSLTIGFLFVTQMMTLVKNLTTLEAFVPGIDERVPWKKPTTSQNIQEITGESSWFCPTAPFSQYGYMPFEI